MSRRWKVLLSALLVLMALIPVATLMVQITHAASLSNGNGTASAPMTVADPPLSQFTVQKLSGGTQVVVYDGDVLLIGSSATTTLSGFRVPAGDVSKTTWIVADGQCGTLPTIPLPCQGGRPTAGSGDTAALTGGQGTLTIGPDAFKGSDPCPWGPDTCLWDTRTADVTNSVASGDTSVTATVSSGDAGDGIDCINDIAQVFSTGPQSAAASEGYMAAGVGLRNQGSGSITLTGIPANAQVVQALLYWSVLDPSDPGGAMSVNGNPITGTQISANEGDPCWGAQNTWAFRSDVTSLISGNGTYTLSGYPTGSTGGSNPWDSASPVPMAEGASLIVIYQSSGWGVDSFEHISQPFYNKVVATFGTPAFWGRYIGTGFSKDMALSEISIAQTNHLAILPIYFNYDTSAVVGFTTGQAYAKAAIKDAQTRLGIPQGVAIFVDIEAGASPDAAFIKGWYDTFNSTFTYGDGKYNYQAGYYKAGYYANTLTSSHFDTPFCTAVGQESAIGTNSFIWTPQLQPQGFVSAQTTKANMPMYNPVAVSCPNQQIPIPAAWQYSIQNPNQVFPPNVDLDEALPSLPLWHP